MSIPGGIRVKLALALLAIVGGALLAAYGIIVPSLERRLVDAKLDQQQSDAETLSIDFATRAAQNNLSLTDFVDASGFIANSRVIVLGVDGSPKKRTLLSLADSASTGGSEMESDPTALRAATTVSTVRARVRHEGREYAEVAVPLLTGGDVMLLSSSLSDQLATVALVKRRLLYATVAALLIAVGLGFAVAALHARRLGRLQQAADRIAEGAFDEPVVDNDHDEVGQLAASFDRMRLQLAQLDSARKEFVANASHELRTPLFSIAGFLELLDDEDLDESTRREFLATTRSQVDRLTNLATDLLDLSRMDAGRIRIEREEVGLAEVARRSREDFFALADASHHTLLIDVDEDAWAFADEERIQQIVRALAGNALVHTPPGQRCGCASSVAGRGLRWRSRTTAPGSRPLMSSASSSASTASRAARPPGAASVSRSRASLRAGWAARSPSPRAPATRSSRSSFPRRPPRRGSHCASPASPFPRGNARQARGYSEAVRAPVIAIAAVAAILGAVAALALGNLTGLTGGDTSTVVVERTLAGADAPATAAPELGNGFNPAAIYARRAPGVVTLYADLGADGESQGSGFVVDAKGTILTNAHVITNVAAIGGGSVHGAQKLYAEFRDGDRVPARIIGWDLFSDVGVVRVDPKDHALPRSRSARRRRSSSDTGGGDWQSLRRAELALGRSRLGNRPHDRLADVGLQRLGCDPDRRPHQSRQLGRAAVRCPRPRDRDQRPDPLHERQRGGSRFRDPDRHGPPCARPARAHGPFAYAYVGVTTQDVTPGLAKRFGFTTPHGALIAKVEPGTPADRAGLHGGNRTVDYNGLAVSLGGDVIVSIDGMRVAGADDVSRAVARLAAGSASPSGVRGGTDRRLVQVKLAERPA